MALYYSTGLYIFLTLALAIRRRERLSKPQLDTILVFCLLVCLAAAIQYLVPTYLVTGMALALGILMMYLTLQNPDDMLDTLTGVYTRGSFVIYTTELFRTRKKFGAVAADICDTSVINSAVGVNVGDALIAAVASEIAKCAVGAKVFRTSADNFIIISDHHRPASEIVSSMRTRFMSPVTVLSYKLSVALTISYIDSSDGVVNTDELLGLLEYSLERAKSWGKGTALLARDSDVLAMRRKSRIASALSEAMENGTLKVWLQPIYNVSSSRFTMAEALSRLDDPELGRVSPDEFIPIAEKGGLIKQLGAYVLERVCIYIRENDLCAKNGFERVTINLSVAECIDEDLPDTVMRTINRYALDPHLFEFEITETIATISDKLPKSMERLRENGVRFSIDDFGTGFANLDSVIRLPFTTVKIDRSVLAGCDAERGEMMFSHIASLTRSFGMEIVVEGVETQQQADMLKRLGIDYFQGYYFAKPMSMNDCSKLLSEQDKPPQVLFHN